MNGKIAIDTTEDYVAADSHIFFPTTCSLESCGLVKIGPLL